MKIDPNLNLPNPTHKMTLWVEGSPPGKPRMTQRDRWKERTPVMKYRRWKDKVRKVLNENPIPATAEIVKVSWTAYFEIPKSWSKKKKAEKRGSLHTQRPDRDNIDKALLDALWEEDSHIAWGTVLKVWCPEHQEPGINITIEYM